MSTIVKLCLFIVSHEKYTENTDFTVKPHPSQLSFWESVPSHNQVGLLPKPNHVLAVPKPNQNVTKQ